LLIKGIPHRQGGNSFTFAEPLHLLNLQVMFKYVSGSFLLFVCYLNVHAQKQDSLFIRAIPHSLFWENMPNKYSIHKDTLDIQAGAKTDMFRDPNVTYNTDNAPKLMFYPDEDFVLTASIEHAFANKWDGGAIVVWQDSLNWIKFCFEKDYTGARRVVSVVTKNISDDCNSMEIQKNKVFYKVAKAGNVITLYCSVNGKKWFLVRHLQFDADKKLQVGFLAQSPTGESCSVQFANITYKAKKIADPYLGE
jgi:regulation of enolase protein 1 (concanavalin A-like superfamily)